MVIGVSTETPTKTIEETKTKQKAKKPKKETTPTPKEKVTPPTTPPPKEPPKETKPTTKEAKPPTTTPTRKPKIETIDWEKFEKFETKAKTVKKSWIKDVIERAKKEPVKLTGLTKGQLMALITQVNRHNRDHEPKILIKYDTKKGIALLAPLTKKQ